MSALHGACAALGPVRGTLAAIRSRCPRAPRQGGSRAGPGMRRGAFPGAGTQGETMAAGLDRRPIVFVRIAAFALAAALVLGGCSHDAPEPYRLPTGARLDPG